MSLITPALVEVLRAQFRLDWQGIHGAPHWERVRASGLKLTEHTGASHRVVEYFAFRHDSQRRNEHTDPGHCDRGAVFAATLLGAEIQLNGHELELLHACAGHSDGHLEADITVMTCSGTGRLDLGRVGIGRDPERPCPAAARGSDMIEWDFGLSSLTSMELVISYLRLVISSRLAFGPVAVA